jgi:hypothetical protein
MWLLLPASHSLLHLAAPVLRLMPALLQHGSC